MRTYIDAHLHLKDYVDCCRQATNLCSQADSEHALIKFAYPCRCCFSAHNYREFLEQYRFAETIRRNNQAQPFTLLQPLYSFGIHPQLPVFDEAENLFMLLQKKQIHAIGECGFDLFTDEYRRTEGAQHKIWELQLDLAVQFDMPIIIHCRKGLHLIFAAVPKLKRLPAVIFHGWSGSVQEAASFLKKGVNAYFSIGKAVLRGQKSVCAAAASLDIQRIVTETDAPYMRLKNEAFTHPLDITVVAKRCALLRGISLSEEPEHSNIHDESAYTTFLKTLEDNFCRAFTIPVSIH